MGWMAKMTTLDAFLTASKERPVKVVEVGASRSPALTRRSTKPTAAQILRDKYGMSREDIDKDIERRTGGRKR
jgi:hypothetical protein